MTALFDSKAIELLNSFEKSNLTGEEHARDLVVYVSSVKEARGYIAKYHYSHSMPDSTKFVFKGMYWDELAWFCVFGMGCWMNQYRSIDPKIEDWTYCELTRLWLYDKAPKNSESRIISEALKLLPKEIKLVLSYADSKQSHEWTIYKATNWIQLWMTNGWKILVNSEWKEFHPRLIEMYKRRHPETIGKMSKKEILQHLWFHEILAGKKHRFVKIINLNKKQTKILSQQILTSQICIPAKIAETKNTSLKHTQLKQQSLLKIEKM